MVTGNGITEDPNTQEEPTHKEGDDNEKEHSCLLKLSFSHIWIFTQAG